MQLHLRKGIDPKYYQSNESVSLTAKLISF
jgi:hypothetical protein